MQMENLLAVSFEAHNPNRNHRRRYEVVIGRDLLDSWTLAIRYGRIGQGGRELRYAGTDPAAIRAIIRRSLRRRLSAPTRIGCPYRLVAVSAAPGFDPFAWLPGEVMGKFFQVV
jgi:predicted DNA-binding WGR domain protein